MSKELVIGSNRHETKVAVLEEDQLVEVYFQRANEYSLAGSIHKGRVTRVLPGMQSAFVDLGLERDTFLYVSDFFEENEDIDTVTDEKPPARSDRGERNERRDRDRGPVRQALPPSSSSLPPQTAVAAEPRMAILQTVPVPSDEELAEEPFPEDAVSDSLPGEQRAIDAAPEAKGIGGVGGAARAIEPVSRETRPDGQRGDDGRGGDRRGRRSRRRRTRGSGFPETKYAQPGSENVPRNDGALSAESEVIEVGEEDQTSAPEPIILPGESLAKYRHLASAPDTEPRAALDPESDIEDAGNAEYEAEPPEFAEDEPAHVEALHQEAVRQEIEEEARALELADRVLSHADEYVDEDEEKYAEIRHDQPTSPFIVGDIDTEEAVEDGAGPVEHGTPRQHASPVEPLAANVQVALPESSEPHRHFPAAEEPWAETQATPAALSEQSHPEAASTEAAVLPHEEDADDSLALESENFEVNAIEAGRAPRSPELAQKVKIQDRKRRPYASRVAATCTVWADVGCGAGVAAIAQQGRSRKYKARFRPRPRC